MQSAFIDNAKVMAKGQVTIPKDVRAALGINCGDRVTFVVEGKNVKLVNAAVYRCCRVKWRAKRKRAVLTATKM